MKKFGPEFLSSLSPKPHIIRYLLTYVALFLGSGIARVSVRGKYHLPKKGPYVIASNHFSDYDPLFFSYGIQKPINFIAASDQELDWWLVWAPIIYGWIPVDRQNLSPSTIKRSLEVLRRGELLGIFPDGGVSYNLLSQPKNGAVYLSTLGKAPIVPIGIYGAERAWEGMFKGIRSRICINIGKPFGPFNIKGNKGQKVKALNAVGNEMMCRIAALLPPGRQGPFSESAEVIKYQKENLIKPKPQPHFKALSEE